MHLEKQARYQLEDTLWDRITRALKIQQKIKPAINGGCVRHVVLRTKFTVRSNLVGMQRPY
jgi:F0F1-type ATP synthase delta subunit